METEPHSLHILTTGVTLVIYEHLSLAAGITFLLLCLSTLISAFEIASYSVGSAFIERISQQKSRKNLFIKSFLDDEEKLHLTIVLANLFLFVVAALLLFPSYKLAFQDQLSSNAILITFAIIFGILIIIFTEFLPRFFSAISEEYITFMAIPMLILQFLLSPITVLIINSSGTFRKKIIHSKHQISIQDISNALEFTTDSSNKEEDILMGIVKFGNIDVRKIVHPRIDVVAVDKDLNFEDLFKVVVDSGYSRIPVYSETFDNIIGILYVKDLLPYLNDKDSFQWQKLIRPPYFVPESKKVKELLKDFQTKKIHMALVVDEYGGTTGIVTLEDIIEEIVGDIADESDEDEKIFTKLNENTFLFDGKTLLNDFCKITETEETIFDEVKGDADTLAGLILELKGEIPEKNQEIEFEPFVFTIEVVDNRRIKQVKVTKNLDKAEKEED